MTTAGQKRTTKRLLNTSEMVLFTAKLDTLRPCLHTSHLINVDDQNNYDRRLTMGNNYDRYDLGTDNETVSWGWSK